MSLHLLDAAIVGSGASVVDVGGGTADSRARYSSADTPDVVLELSTVALRTASARLGKRGSLIQWAAGDVRSWRPDRSYIAWHDRAVLHFLTAEADRASYLHTLRLGTEPGSVAVIATSAPDGPQHCSGLPVARYSATESRTSSAGSGR